jgi:Tol biopolymer transport system component
MTPTARATCSCGTESTANGSSNVSTVSANGRYVAFVSVAANPAPGDANGTSEVFVRPAQGRDPPGVSPAWKPLGSGYSDSASISADGRRVALRLDRQVRGR